MPTPEAVKLMHKLRTYGKHAEFALTDEHAAEDIDRFAAQRGAKAIKVVDALRRHGDDATGSLVIEQAVWAELSAFDKGTPPQTGGGRPKFGEPATRNFTGETPGPGWKISDETQRELEQMEQRMKVPPQTGGGDAWVRKDFYEAALRSSHRESAEAMREDCAKAARGPGGHDECDHGAGYRDGRLDAALAIEALPIPGMTDAG